MKRIVIVGPSGAGKTSLAKLLARRILAVHIELDSLHWNPHWQEAPKDVFRQRVTAALAGHDRWIVDGNYSKARDIIWTQADTLLWLDYGFWLVLRRNVTRTLRRAADKSELWSGNRESFRKAFSKDSIILYLIHSWASTRRKYEQVLVEGNLYPHLQIHRFGHPRELDQWLRAT